MSHEPKFEHAHPHASSVWLYVRTLFFLMLLMGATIGAYYLDFSHLIAGNPQLGTLINNLVAMTIACLKATIVISIFMGVWYSTKLTKMYALMGFVWVGLMGIVFCDYGTRHLEVERGWEGIQQVPVTEMNLPAIDPEAVKKAHVEGHGEESGESHSAAKTEAH